MKRLVLIAVFLLLFSLSAFAQGRSGSTWFALGFTGAQARYLGPPRDRLWWHEWREDQRLREHQMRERQACRLHPYRGKCRFLAEHERREWERLRAHQQWERNWYWRRW